MALPIIDISPFLPSTSTSAPPSNPTRAHTAKAIHAAILNQGFFVLHGTGSLVPKAEMDQALDVAHAFFQTSAEEKRDLRIRKGDGARGYQLLGENVTQYKADHHEALDLYRPVTPPQPDKLLHGENQWPSNPAYFRSFLEEIWIPKMKIIGMALMEATAMGLGIDLASPEWESLKSSVLSSFWVMRVIGYPPLPPSAPGISCGQHTDYGCYTLLHATPTHGSLQVFLRSSSGTSIEDGEKGTWLDVDPIELDKDGTGFVVNIGAMWEVWSNGLYKATLHRVVHKGSEYRVSLPFFFEPNIDAVVSPLPSAIKLQADLEQGEPEKTLKESLVYGEYLGKKVAGNFQLED